MRESRQTPTGLSAEEKKALQTLRKEAKAQGSSLHRAGKGGLPPSLALGVFRRDHFQCKACGTKANLYIHHKGGIVASLHLSRMGHRVKMNNLVTLCNKCHNRLHNQARMQGLDSSQVTPIGDIGTNDDVGRKLLKGGNNEQ